MADAVLSVDEILAILRASVSRIDALIDGRSAADLRARPEPGEWSAHEILAHLRASQDVLGRSIERILQEDRPSWRRRSPREWQRSSGYQDWEFGPARDAFAHGRTDLLAAVEPVRLEDWERVAIVTVAPNRSVAQSARFFGDWLAGHERIHLEQLERTLAAVAVPPGTG